MRKVDEDFARRLKITSFGEDGLTYYSLYTGGYWDILGFCDFADERIAIRLLHFEDEFLDDESFVAEQHASPYFSFNVLGCQQFLSFVEQVVLGKPVLPSERMQHFEKLNILQLRELHYSGTEGKRWYKYVEETASRENEKISLSGLPNWDKKYGIHQMSGLWFITIDTSYLENDHFDLIRDSHGLGTITIVREALEEIVSMIRETLREIDDEG